MKNKNDIARLVLAIVLMYFGGVKLLASFPIDVLVGLISSDIANLILVKYFLLPLVGILEIILAVVLLVKNLRPYFTKILWAYLPLLGLSFVLEINIEMTDSPFLIAFNTNALISHMCVVSLMLIISNVKTTPIKA